MLGRRAEPRGPHGADCAPWGASAGRLAALGATLEFHHGLLDSAEKRARTLLKKLALSFVLVYAIAFRVVTLDRPFDYDDEATGSFYGVLARNYLRLPWSETNGVPVLTVGRLAGVPLTLYPDHPPLAPLLIAAIYRMFGVGEWQTRLPTSVAMVLAVAAMYRLMQRGGAARPALISAALFAAMPMVLHFGGQPEVLGTLLTLFALLTVDAYLNFHDRISGPALARLAGVFTLAAASDWPAFILIPVLAMHFAATRPWRQWGWMVAFAAIATAEFVVLNVYIAVAAKLPWDWMVPLVKGRAALGPEATFTAREWLRTAWAFNRHCHTLPLLVAATAWVVLKGSGRVRLKPDTTGESAARLLLAWGVAHVLIGRQGVYNHEWWWWPLTPGIAAAAALLLEATLQTLERRRPAPGASTRRHALRAAAMPLVIVLVFTAWTTIREVRELYPTQQDDGWFTTVELGRAIQIAAPQPDDLAMLAWSGFDPQLWFYGDRPLRADIWTVDEFTARVSGDEADLPFGYPQPWPARAAGLVFPVRNRATMAELYAYLAARYPRVRLPDDLADHFEVFDLRSSGP